MKKVSLLAASAAVLALTCGAAITACGEDKPAAAPVKVDAPKPVEAPKAPEPVKVDAPAPKAPEVVAVPVNLKDAGSITGVVKVVDAPRRKKIKMDADAKCAALHAEAPLSDEVVADANGHVQYAFVWIKSGLEGKELPKPSAPALLDQKGCRYEPHVVGVMVGQELLIRNSDDLLHNIHALPFENKEFNFGQPSKGMEEKKAFTKQEVMVKVKCDVHPWMSAWVGVVSHPCFAVTDAAGKFEIKGVPAGKYKVEVWQEKYKSVEMDVEVKAGAAATANFEMKEKRE